MGKEDVLYIKTHTQRHTTEYSSAIKKNIAICSNMNGHGGHYAEISQTKINTVWYHLYMESKNTTNQWL